MLSVVLMFTTDMVAFENSKSYVCTAWHNSVSPCSVRFGIKVSSLFAYGLPASSSKIWTEEFCVRFLDPMNQEILGAGYVLLVVQFTILSLPAYVLSMLERNSFSSISTSGDRNKLKETFVFIIFCLVIVRHYQLLMKYVFTYSPPKWT